MDRVLFFGGSGFIGKHIVNLLAKNGYCVDLVTHSSNCNESTKYNKNVCIVHANIFNADQLKRIFESYEYRYCIDLAWECGDNYINSLKNFDWIIATLNIAKHFSQSKDAKKLLVAGSVLEYDLANKLLDEKHTPLNNVSYYGKSKALTYTALSQYMANFSNIQFKWTRIFNLFGENEKQGRLVPYIIQCIKSKTDIRLKANNDIDYSYVKDTAAAIFKTFQSDYSGAINICSGKTISLNEIAKTLCNKFNYDIKHIKFMNQPSKVNDAYVCGKNEILKNEVGYEYRYNFEAGVNDYL